MKKNIAIIIVSLIGFCKITAQDFIEINGRIYDGETNKPLYMASISLSGTSLSNISNSEGIFSLKIPGNRDYMNDSLLISHMGYHRVLVPVSSIVGAKNTIYNIFLTPTIYAIDQAKVTPQDAQAIVDRAFASVKYNYSDNNNIMTAFYREMILKGTRRYLSMNEAVLDINKYPAFSGIDDNVGIYKGRGTVNIEKDDSLLVQLQGGAITSLRLDIVKDPFIGVYLQDIHRYYDFTQDSPVMMGNKTFYKINFQQKPHVRELLTRGSLYIDTQTYAIARIEFYMNVETRPDAYRYFVRKKAENMEYFIDKAYYLVNYKENVDGLWYLDYTKFELNMTTKKKRALFKKHFTIIAEMAITDIEKGKLRIDREHRLNMNDIIQSRVKDYTDENFWEGYNIIEPDESISNIILRITRQLKRQEREIL